MQKQSGSTEDGNTTDECFGVRRHFIIGNYQTAINEATTLRPKTDQGKQERDILTYRSYLALSQYSTIMNELKPKQGPLPLQAIRIAAEVLSKQKPGDSVDIAPLKSFLQQGAGLEANCVVIFAPIFVAEGLLEDAWRILMQVTSLEVSSQLIQIYLRFDRIELAEKEVKKLLEADEDSPWSQLSQAFVLLAIGTEKAAVEAQAALEELSEQTSSALLLNAQAIASLSLGKYEQAEKQPLEALEKNPRLGETLSNLGATTLHLKKPTELVNRYLGQLKATSPTHATLSEHKLLDESFTRNSARYSLTS